MTAKTVQYTLHAIITKLYITSRKQMGQLEESRPVCQTNYCLSICVKLNVELKRFLFFQINLNHSCLNYVIEINNYEICQTAGNLVPE